MPNKNPEKARQLKHEWYIKNRGRLLQQKRERRAAKKKLKPPRPPKAAPTPEQKPKPERRTDWPVTDTERPIRTKYAA